MREGHARRSGDGGFAQIWDWHPVVFPDEHEDQVAHVLIMGALLHLEEMGLRKVAIDFRVTESTRSCFEKYPGWYRQAGIADIIEETFYTQELAAEGPERPLPEGYSLGRISETGLDDLYRCWLEVFATSDDQVFGSLDAGGRRDLFLDSWGKEKPVIDEASLTLHWGHRLVGFSRVLPMDKPADALLAPIGILPGYRRKGLARQLLTISMRRLKALGYQTVSCYVSTGNAAAVAFYERLGFAPKQSIASLFGEIALREARRVWCRSRRGWIRGGQRSRFGLW